MAYFKGQNPWTKSTFEPSLWCLASVFSAKADTTGYHPWDTGCYKNIPVMRQKCKLIRHTVYVDVNHVVDIIGKGSLAKHFLDTLCAMINSPE